MDFGVVTHYLSIYAGSLFDPNPLDGLLKKIKNKKYFSELSSLFLPFPLALPLSDPLKQIY